MKKFLAETLSDRFGTKSSKRLSGLSLMLIGTIEKIVLFIMGLLSQINNITELDNSANWFIATGGALVFGSVFEAFGKQDQSARRGE